MVKLSIAIALLVSLLGTTTVVLGCGENVCSYVDVQDGQCTYECIKGCNVKAKAHKKTFLKTLSEKGYSCESESKTSLSCVQSSLSGVNCATLYLTCEC
jgi:hypothetical protein